jgi:hypothetical protein
MQVEQLKAAMVAVGNGGKDQCDDRRKRSFFTITTRTEWTAEGS